MPPTQTHKIHWQNEEIGELSQAIPDVWYLEGKWKPFHSDKSLIFEKLAKEFDTKEVMKDPTKGTRIQLSTNDSDEKTHAVVMSLQDDCLLVRRVYNKEAIEWLIANVD